MVAFSAEYAPRGKDCDAFQGAADCRSCSRPIPLGLLSLAGILERKIPPRLHSSSARVGALSAAGSCPTPLFPRSPRPSSPDQAAPGVLKEGLPAAFRSRCDNSCGLRNKPARFRRSAPRCRGAHPVRLAAYPCDPADRAARRPTRSRGIRHESGSRCGRRSRGSGRSARCRRIGRARRRRVCELHETSCWRSTYGSAALDRFNRHYDAPPSMTFGPRPRGSIRSAAGVPRGT